MDLILAVTEPKICYSINEDNLINHQQFIGDKLCKIIPTISLNFLSSNPIENFFFFA